MPTGCTAKVEDGSMTEFRDYAMLCARAFGATIMMRDESLDTPIPEFQVSDYHEKAEREAKRKLNALVESPDAELRQQWQKEYDDEVAYRHKANERGAAEKARYEAMLAKVEAWEPPSSEHNGLKKFMADQIRESMRFGGYEREVEPQQPFEEWKAGQITRAKREIAYHKREYALEVARTEERNLWVRQLRESLDKERPVSAPIY